MNDGKSHNFTTCIQIIPRADQILSKYYRLRIKDPSFVSIFNPSYTFYFGQIQVQAIKCQPTDAIESWSKRSVLSFNHLVTKVKNNCGATGPKNMPIQAGIKKPDSKIDTITPVFGRTTLLLP